MSDGTAAMGKKAERGCTLGAEGVGDIPSTEERVTALPADSEGARGLGATTGLGRKRTEHKCVVL